MSNQHASESLGETRVFSTFPAFLSSAGRRMAALLPAAILIAGLVAGPTPIQAQGRSNHVRVLSQNMFFGTDFTDLSSVKTPQDIPPAVTALINKILATKPEERVAAMAGEIAKARPDFVALHEAAILRIGSPPITVMDLLQSMLDELAALGEHYALVQPPVNGFDVPSLSTLGPVRFTDRDAILMRIDEDIATINVTSRQFGPPRTTPLLAGLPPLVTPAGYVSIDAIIRGLAMRFVSVHLDPACTETQCDPAALAIQLAQTQELLKLAGDTQLPLVFAGDFNTAANDPSHPSYVIYQTLIDAGLTDVWKRGNPGFTCCQDENLLNPKSKLRARVDLVLFRGDFGVAEVNLIGDKPSDKTPSGLWPSDHAGVTATLTGP